MPANSSKEKDEPTSVSDAEQAGATLAGLIQFLREIDRLKTVERRSWLMDGSRRENSAEHSWHIALAALVLAPYAETPVQVDRVVRMLLIHDLVEIEAGDTFAYDRTGRKAVAELEEVAARRMFGLLPVESAAEMLALWHEFEAQSTPEAKFAKAMDRLLPVLHNFYTQGATWREYDISYEQVFELNAGIEQGSSRLWEFVQELLGQAVAKGYLYHRDPNRQTPNPTQDMPTSAP